MKKLLSVLLLVVLSIGLFGACKVSVPDDGDKDHTGEIDFSAGYD